jgi:hypothetical protein
LFESRGMRGVQLGRLAHRGLEHALAVDAATQQFNS